MDTLQINRINAQAAYDQGSQQEKSFMEKLFGKEAFNRKPTERIKTYDDACSVLGISSHLSVEASLTGADDAAVAFIKLTTISRALNMLANEGQDWKPDWSNTSQPKWYPWLRYSAGSGFAFGGCGCDRGVSYVGSRLCFKTEELAKYAATQFPDLYNQLFTL